MTIKEIIQKLNTTMTDASGQESPFESWLILNEGIIDAIDALKALDKQEPVAWEQFYPDIGKPKFVAQPEQEPVAWMVWGEDNVPSLTFKKPSDKYVFDSLYITPPHCKPLTDEEVEKIIKSNMSLQMNLAGIRADIEAAHNIKENNK